LNFAFCITKIGINFEKPKKNIKKYGIVKAKTDGSEETPKSSPHQSSIII